VGGEECEWLAQLRLRGGDTARHRLQCQIKRTGRQEANCEGGEAGKPTWKIQKLLSIKEWRDLSEYRKSRMTRDSKDDNIAVWQRVPSRNPTNS